MLAKLIIPTLIILVLPLSTTGVRISTEAPRAVAPTPAATLDDETTAWFEGCGTLQIAPQGCLALWADSGEILLVENTDGFWVDDYVFVSGPIVEDSQICFPYIADAIEDNTIAACFIGCGTLAQAPQSCLQIITDDGEAYLVEDSGGYLPGEYVHVKGGLFPESQICFPYIAPAIEGNTIGLCYSGCGELDWGPQTCLVFLGDDGQNFYIKDTDGYMKGARVWVDGRIVEESIMCWPIVGPALVENVVTACDDDGAATEELIESGISTDAESLERIQR
jgi:hypothetical protein